MLSGFSATRFFLQVSMTRRCHNHRLQTKPWHHEEGTQNTDNFNTKKGTRNQITKQESPQKKEKKEKKKKKTTGVTTNDFSTIYTAFQCFIDILNQMSLIW